MSYDIIIVGAGSSGAVLASRLSEDAACEVLLLEAGPDFRSADAPPEMQSANPMGIMNPQMFPQYTWPNLLVRRTARQAPRVYDRGRGLGGSSSINWQVAHRAMLEDYDWWAEQGCVGWSGEELLPAMNRLENDLDFGDAPYHGRGGPITISRPPISRWGKVDLALLEAGLDAGHPWHDDLNAPESTGISATPLNRTEESRISTNDGYLEPARARGNLTIQCGAQADRVLFDGERAIGVSAVIDGQLREFRGHEVILSAGSTFSPPILIRSGVGPAGDILTLGRDVVSDVPVGKNLLDHASVGVQLRLTEAGRCQSWEERNLNCYIRYSSGMPETGLNDMVLGCRNINGYDEDGLLTGALAVILWQSFSRGELHVRDLDPFSMPQIDQNLLSDERDLARMRTGARELFEIAQSRPVRAITSDVCLGEGVTGATQKRIEDVKDQRALDEWLMDTVRDTWHLVGTCRMGAPDDPRSVVDPECRVLGTENLRVIDGSIMPEVPRANTNLTCIAIAEHMARRIASEARNAQRA